MYLEKNSRRRLASFRRADGEPGVGVFRLRGTIRFANRSAPLKMTEAWELW
jgi:hypothetical protein